MRLTLDEPIIYSSRLAYDDWFSVDGDDDDMLSDALPETDSYLWDGFRIKML